MPPIRTLHFADVHIGMENYGRTDPETGLSTRLKDFLARMDEMHAFARAEGVDLIVFAGDAFKSRTPNPTYQREFAYRIADLARLAPVVLLIGNHDVAPADGRASSIEIYRTLSVPNVYVSDEYAVFTVETARGPVVIGTAPYPMRSRLVTVIPDADRLTIREVDDEVRKWLLYRLEEMAEEADAMALGLGPETPRVLTGHFTVSGASLGSERGIMIGRDIEVQPSALADARWDYVALGHIHKHQAIGIGHPPIVYSGSLERIDFGEAGDEKGFCWAELERGRTTWSFQPVAARRFVTVQVSQKDMDASDNPTQTVLDAVGRRTLADAIVRVLLEMNADTNARFKEDIVRDALRRAGAHVFSIRKEIVHEMRLRLGDNPEGLTDADLLDHFLISRQIDGPRRAELAERARDLFAKAAEHAD
jgi:exonuclease SbcD